MKICVFNTLYYPNRKGGAEKSVQLVCEEFVRQGHEVNVVSVWDGVSQKKITINGVTSNKWSKANIYSIHNFDEVCPGYIKKAIWQFVDFFNPVIFFKTISHIKRECPDVIWTNNINGLSLSVWLAAFLCRKPVFHTLRDYSLLSNNVQLFKNSKLLYPGHNVFSKIKVFLFRKLSSHLTGIVGISDFILECHTNHNEKLLSSSSTIYNPVQIIEHIKLKFDDKSSGLVYGYLGQINEAKGINDMISNFLENSKDSKLLLGGNFNKSDYIEYMNTERIKFLGFVDANRFLSQVDILLVPSKWNEPFGRVVVEAINMGIPVLASPKGGLIELTRAFRSVKCHDFKSNYDYDNNRFLFEQSDSRVIKDRFSLEVICKEYLKLFSS